MNSVSDDHQPPTGSSRDWARSLIRPLSRRYGFVLAAVAALVLVDQAILQPLLLQLNFSAPAINLAGRQRMLSQKVTKEVLALAAVDDPRDRDVRRAALQTALEQWNNAHETLLAGDPAKGIRPANQDVAAALHHVEPAFIAISTAAREIAAEDSPAEQARTSASLAAILAQEPVYLSGMESVVSMLEQAANTRVTWLRGCGVAAMIAVLLLLVAVHFYVLQPAANVIRNQVEELAASEQRHRELAEMLREARDTLELRVEERTSELIAANHALEREMTERQAAEAHMRELSTALAQASRVTALGQLATGLAHEINQPLATVANYAGILELSLDGGAAGNEEPKQLVFHIKQAALRAGAIVRRMRNFVGRGSSQAAPVDVNELVREVSELCQCELRGANVLLSLHLTSRPAMLSADPVQIQQVLVNLIHNAMQAMAAVAVDQRVIDIAVHRDANEVRVTVADTGPGFPAEEIQNCFQPFFSSKPDGLGMGLAISRSIIEQHQGRIWSENRERGGAVVGFSLPCLPANDVSADQNAHCLCG